MASFRLVTPADVDGTNPNVGDLYVNPSTGQLELVGGDITDTESYAREIAQRVTTRLRMIRGEWYLDQRLGTPWIERVFRKGATAATCRRVVRDVVQATPGVQSIVSVAVSVDSASRSASVTGLSIIADTGDPVTIADLDHPFIIEVPRG